LTPPRANVPDARDAVWLEFDLQAGHEKTGQQPDFFISRADHNCKTGSTHHRGSAVASAGQLSLGSALTRAESISTVPGTPGTATTRVTLSKPDRAQVC